MNLPGCPSGAMSELPGRPLNVDHGKPKRSANAGVCPVARPQGPVAPDEIGPAGEPRRPIHNNKGRGAVGSGLHLIQIKYGVDHRLDRRQHDGHVIRNAARHYCGDGYFFQSFYTIPWTHGPDDHVWVPDASAILSTLLGVGTTTGSPSVNPFL